MQISFQDFTPCEYQIATISDGSCHYVSIGASESWSEEHFVLLNMTTRLDEAKILHREALEWILSAEYDLDPDISPQQLAEDYGRYLDDSDQREAVQIAQNEDMMALSTFGMF